MSVADERAIEEWLNARPADLAAPCGRIKLGEAVDDWRVEAYLGAGRSAEVYRVVNVRTGCDGALKILSEYGHGLPERFTVEMDVLRFLRLDGFPKFYGNGMWKRRPYYVMEYLQPLLLPLPRREVPAFITAIADTVQALHDAGYVHRDLKPDNILRRMDGTPVLIDLGLIKKMEEDRTVPCRPSGLSLVNGRPVGVGTVDFSAPEQLLKGEASVQSDVFGLGKVLRRCFSGKPPKVWKHIIRHATQEAPADRYGSAAEFARAVRRRHVPRILTGLGLGLLVVGLGSLALFLPTVLRGADEATVPGKSLELAHPLAEPDVLIRQRGESAAEYLARMLVIADRKNNLAAQLLVAEAYFYGRGTETNRAEAVKWYSRAAVQEDANAQASLGLCAFRGWGCERNYDVAAEWYQKAAAQGNLAAMSDLAFCYMNGYGVEKNPQVAFDWAMKAAQRGHAPAQVLVAECYLEGLGTAVDGVRADVWLQSAARQGNARAKMLLEASR